MTTSKQMFQDIKQYVDADKQNGYGKAFGKIYADKDTLVSVRAAELDISVERMERIYNHEVCKRTHGHGDYQRMEGIIGAMSALTRVVMLSQ